MNTYIQLEVKYVYCTCGKKPEIDFLKRSLLETINKRLPDRRWNPVGSFINQKINVSCVISYFFFFVH